MGSGSVALDRVHLAGEPVVGVLGFAVFDVEAPAAGLAGLGEDDALGALGGDLEVGADGVGDGLGVDEAVLGHPGHAGVQGEFGAAEHQVGPAGGDGVEPFECAVVEREDAVLDRPPARKSAFISSSLSGCCVGEVGGEAEVLVHVVELPAILVEVARPRGAGSHGARWTTAASQPSW